MTSQTALVVIGIAWGSGALGRSLGPVGVVVSGLVAAGGLVLWRRWLPEAVLVAVAVVCSVSGWLAAADQRSVLEAPVPEGLRAMTVRVVSDPVAERDGWRSVVQPVELEGLAWRGPALLARGDLGEVRAGDLARVEGRLRKEAFTLRGDAVAGTIGVVAVEPIGGSSGLAVLANSLRERVASTIIPSASSSSALVVGFLIGDTRHVADADLDAMRQSGLSHYVAVSGSNVALFLAAWWLLSGPLAMTTRRRSVLGLVGLVLFVAVTRAEPSVVRAATMAALVLIGRATATPIDGWTAVGGGVALLLAVDGSLVADIGFQLSVAATLGVMAGIRLFRGRSPRWLWAALGASLSAQAAVTPLLLIHFGGVPLVSPVANVITAPLVTASTAVGMGAVVTGIPALSNCAAWFAGLVLGVARLGTAWPQLGVVGVAVVAVGGVVAMTRARPLVAVVSAVVAIATVLPVPLPSVPTLTVLDVGQGDAILITEPRGFTVLVDTGPDPVVLRNALRRHRIRRLDLLVVTHGDSDHVGGLAAVPAPDEVWVPDHADLPVIDAWAGDRNVEVTRVESGMVFTAGELRIHVLGPSRRYASDNDGSVVLLVEAPGAPLVLLPGDAERVALGDLPDLAPDVVLVPHHGAGTTDPRWLQGLDARLALISVGAGNPYGHPAPAIVAALQDVAVCRTDLDGDLVVPLEAPMTIPCDQD
ncbi:MAG: MBL fold metallo-hydrolase [Acidimicrobiia bacterium]|nr:MBL fold metallo-hydrolase [Acidimicrobiia bacterium]